MEIALFLIYILMGKNETITVIKITVMLKYITGHCYYSYDAGFGILPSFHGEPEWR
jgi:hypothetical protein